MSERAMRAEKVGGALGLVDSPEHASERLLTLHGDAKAERKKVAIDTKTNYCIVFLLFLAFTFYFLTRPFMPVLPAHVPEPMHGQNYCA
jgi:hypothetical protein